MPRDRLTPTQFRRALARSVALPPLLLGALALVFLGQIAFLLRTAGRVDHTDLVIARASALLRLLVDGETGVRGYALTGDPAFLTPYRAEEEGSGSAFDELESLVSDNPAQVEQLRELRAGHERWREFARGEVELRRAGGTPSAAREREGKRRMDALRAQVGEFTLAEERLREERSRAARRATWAVVGASLGLALALGAALAVATRRQLLRVSANYQAALATAEERAESLRRSARRLATLHDIDRAILAAEDPPDLAGSALRQMGDAVPGDAFVIAYGPGGPRVIGRDGAGPAEPALAAPAEPSERDGPRVVADLAAAGDSPLDAHLRRSGHRSCVTVPLDTGGRRFGVLVLADARPGAFDEEHREVAREVARQLAIAFQQAELREQLRRHAEELERRVEERTRELSESRGSERQLRGLLPICAWCKRVRDDRNYWHQVEHYFAAHTDAQFTHGVCPGCQQQLAAEAEQANESPRS